MEINDPRNYYRSEIKTLGWELTVCNALSSPASPCRRTLKVDKPYGALLYDFIAPPLTPPLQILEVGGGYGVLMRDFLKPHSSHGVQLWDISPALLAKQRETLSGFNVSFAECDFLAVGTEALSAF